MLALEQITVQQGGFTLQANWQLEPGTRVGVIGPSGAGKSTLLAALGGFATLAKGRILLAGQDISAANPQARGMAMLFQDGNLFPGLTLEQNVGLGLRPALRLDARERETVKAALARVGLESLGARLPADVSGGQQGRAALARVLLQAKPWLLLDEPFAALGPALRAEMLELVKQVLDETGAGLLMVTHDPKDAAEISEKIILVDQGTAQAPVATGPLFADPPAALRAYLG